MAAILSFLLAPLVAVQPADVEAALADRATLPIEAVQTTHYLTLSTSPEQERADLAVAIKLMIASASRQPIIERCTPVEITPEVYRIDTRDLLWDNDQWRAVLRAYPYHQTLAGPPLILRADWLLLKLADQVESDAYPRLLFGVKPKTRDEALKILGVDTTGGTDTPDYRNFGMVEGNSGVAKNHVRWIENRPITRGYAWGTRDILRVEQGKDPLENLTGGFNQDGEEWIIGLPKHSLATGSRGALQVYFLANADGRTVDRAPVDLVEDATRFRGLREIRAPGSCVQCHSKGLNEPTLNELRALIGSGVDVYSDKQTQQQLEAFHLAELTREIERNQEDFATAVEIVTGLKPEEAAAAFKRAVDRYDAPLDLEATAREMRVTVDDWKSAVAYASANGIALGARLAGLPHGRKVAREAWEDRFHEAEVYLQNWRQ